jgi:phage terminase small subunit
MAGKKRPAVNKAAGKKPKKTAKKAVKPAKSRKRIPQPIPLPVKKEGLDALPMKQQQFVLEYMGNGFNATQAAIAAGYAEKSADTQGSRLLANPKIKAVLAERTQKITAKREITAEWVLDGIAKVAAFDVRKLYNVDGSLKPITELDDETSAAVASVGTRELYADGKPFGVLKNIKMADRLRALELLGRYLKLFVDRVEHSADKEFVLTVKSILKGGK